MTNQEHLRGRPSQGRLRLRQGSRGFTLVEMMMGVTIVGVLATLGTYSVRSRLVAAKSVEAVSTLGEMQSSIVSAASQLDEPGLELGRTVAFGPPNGNGNNGNGNGNGNNGNGGGPKGDVDGDGNHGHGNNPGGCDPSNPGKGKNCSGDSGSSGNGNGNNGNNGNGNGNNGNNGNGNGNGGGPKGDVDGDGNHGHGNNPGGCDPSNPGKGKKCSPDPEGSDGDPASGGGEGPPSGGSDGPPSGGADGSSPGGSDDGSPSADDEDSAGQRRRGNESVRLCGTADPVPASFEEVRGRRYHASPAAWRSGDRDNGWACLRMSRSGSQHYQYGYDVGGSKVSGPEDLGGSFTAWARGDLDGDGRTSWFTLEGAVIDGQLVIAPTINTIDPGE